MILLDQLEKVDLQNSVVTSGTFDGVHFGHRKILRQVIDEAKRIQGQSVVLTYWPHPRFVLGKGSTDLKLLTTFEEKVKLMEETGIDYLVKIHFTREFSELTSREFINDILLRKIDTRKLIIGYDHRFGKNQEGSFQYIKENQEEFGFEVVEIAPQDIDDVTVSSTKIRNALLAGDVRTANEYLGRHYNLSGLVAKGDQLGRKLGYPTANIYVPEDYKLIPADGVYAVKVHLSGKTYGGMLNIGNRPTVMGKHRTIEVNLFNFDKDIYGLKIEVDFVECLRGEQKFSGLDQLKEQLSVDKERAAEILAKE